MGDLHVLFQDIRGLQKQLQDVKGDLQKNNLQNDEAKLKDEKGRSGDMAAALRAAKAMKEEDDEDSEDLGDDVKDVQEAQKFPERHCTTVVDECPESSPSSRRMLITRKPESKQWVAAKSPGVYGDIGDRIRDKLLNRQNQIKALSQQRRHSTGMLRMTRSMVS